MPSPAGPYAGFRATGAIMTHLAKLDPSGGGAVLLRHTGLLGQR